MFTALHRALSVFEFVKGRGLEGDMINSEIPAYERDGLWSCLPTIHVAAIDTIWVIFQRVGIVSMSFTLEILEQLVWTFDREQETQDLRK